MCVDVAGLLGFKPPKPPDPQKLPPIQKTNPEPAKTTVDPKPITEDKKPKVDYAKKMSIQRAKRVGASDLKIPLAQQAAGGSTGGLNV
jgi:hypothetical protein